MFEFTAAAWWSSLLAIILIDLVLAGDNAIVIALAARTLPARLQRRAIIWGTVGAVILRIGMTASVVWLLRIPGLMLIGGMGLVWIASRLLADNDDTAATEGPPRIRPAPSFAGAIRTIVVADALMGIDNVLGVAGAAHGALDLVVLGLLVSVPIVVFGSSIVLKLVERWPLIIHLGAAVLAWTGAHMIATEPLLQRWFGAPAPAEAGASGGWPLLRWVLGITCIGIVLGADVWRRWLQRRSSTAD